MEGTKMERRRTLTMNFAGLDDDDDDRFFESKERISSAISADLMSSGSDEEDEFFEASRMSVASAASGFNPQEFFEASRMSVASTASGFNPHEFRSFPASPEAAITTSPVSPDYNVWMAAPGSITERRKRLLQDMGLSTDKELLSFKRVVSNKLVNGSNNNNNEETEKARGKPNNGSSQDFQSPLPVVLVRSRSEGDIETFSVDKRRKEELVGLVSKQRLTRTSSMIFAPQTRICPYGGESVRTANKETGNVRSGPKNTSLSTLLSNSGFGAFFLIKNLDTGNEFIVNGYDEDGMWNKLSDMQTGKQLTMEEFEKSVGYSPVVKELMRRENVSRENERKLSANSYLSKSLRMSKRRGAALLKNIREVASSINLRTDNKEKETCSSTTAPTASVAGNKQGKNPSNNNSNSNNSNPWVKVRQTGKSYKELSALHLCQEIQAHEGSIWSIKFSLDSRYLASAGEDRVIHVWEVQECEVMSMSEGNLTPNHPSMSPLHSSLCNAAEKSGVLDSPSHASEKKKKGKNSSNKKGDTIPEYVHVPETVFGLSEKPVCSFKGHLDDVLDLSWSRSQLLLSSSMDKTVRLWDLETNSCLKLFAHNDYVTCIQFNPMDDDYFISGSLDAKVRIWSIPDRQVVDWTDLHEMVTAACYTPDGQSALIGSHKGSCRMYNAEDSKLGQQSQIDLKNKKKSNPKKITGFQYSPMNPTEVLVTSADSGIRILDGSDLVQKLSGFRNTSSQIAASFSSNGKYIVCASEDSQVYVWKREEPRNSYSGKKISMVNTRSYEHFQCRDVSAAIPWHGTVKGDPPPMPVQSKRHSKRLGTGSANCSPTKEDSHGGGLSKRLMLPPLPKRNNNKMDRVSTPPEDELAQISRTNSGIGDSFSSNSSSIRYDDSPSISAACEVNSVSVRRDDSSSLSSSIRNGSSSSSIRQGDSPKSSSIRHGDASSSSWSSSWSWFDGGNHVSNTIQPTAWGLVIVTATLGGEIRAYQNFGVPRRIGRQANLF